MENEKRLIDATELLAMGHKTKLIEVFPEWKELPLSAQKAVCKYGGFLKKMIQHLPTVDAVEVVRCKDCDFKIFDNACQEYYCTNAYGLNGAITDDTYCSYGERRSDDT